MRHTLRNLAALLVALHASAQDAAPPVDRIPGLLAAQRERVVKAAAAATDAAERARLESRAQMLQKVLAAPADYRVQVTLAEIVEEQGVQQLRRTTWRAGEEYFYPASAIRLCGVVAACERLNDLKAKDAPELDENTPLAFHPIKPKGEIADADPTNLEGGKLTLAQLVRRTCLVSDNEAFNRLYDLCGQDWVNQRMWRAGLTTVRLQHRLGLRESQNDGKHTPAIELRLPTGPRLVAARWGTLDLGLGPAGYRKIYIGESHIADDGSVTPQGMSFFYENAATLLDLQSCLVKVVRPDLKLEGEPFDLSEAQRALLLDALSRYPGDSTNPKYERARYPDAYCKFFLPGLERALGAGAVASYDEIGLAYGFALDNAYVVEKATGRAFFLSATIYANSDGVLNDDKYDYETVGLPFLEELGEAVARELWRSK